MTIPDHGVDLLLRRPRRTSSSPTSTGSSPVA